MNPKSAFVSKVLVPRSGSVVVRRSAILRRLLADQAQLVVIVAPAGYGKTTLLIDCANESPGAVSWLSLDEWDRDPVTFLSYFKASVAEPSRDLSSRRFDSIREISSLHDRLGEIVLEAESHGGTRTFILDDFHLVEESEPVVALVDYLAKRLSAQMKLIVASRRPLPLSSIPRLRLDGKVEECGPEDLAFGREEIAEYYRNQGSEISDPSLDGVLAATGGWPAGVALIGDPSSLDDQRSARAVAEYVGAEVLRGLSNDLRNFLIRTSVLDVLDVDSCDWLLEADGARDLLARMATSSIPLTRDSGDRFELRIHPLVRDHLQSVLKSQEPSLYKGLQVRAAQRFESLGQQSEAVSHYIEGEEWTEAARLIEQQAPHFYRRGRWHTIAAWIREFPSTRIVSYPKLRWWEARILARLGEIDRSLRVIGEVILGLEDPVQESQFETLKASALRTKGDVSGAVAAARQAYELAINSNAPIDVVADARKELGLALMAEGSASEAVEEFRAVLVLQERRGNTEEAAFVNGCLGSALGASGRLAESTEHLERSRQQWQMAGNAKELSWVLNNLGITYQRMGQVELANDALNQCVAKSRQSGNRRAEAYALISLADIDIDHHRAEEAKDRYQSALEIATDSSDHTALTHARCGLAIAHGKLGDTERGLALARLALASARDRGSLYEEGIAVLCLGRLLRQRGDLSEAMSHLSEAVSLFERTSSSIELGQALLHLSDTALSVRGSRSLARVSLERFVKLTDTIGEGSHISIPTADISNALEYGAGKRIGGKLFMEMLRRRSAQERTGAPEVSGGRLPEVRLRALGAFEVEVGGRGVLSFEWESEKARELFLLLTTSKVPLTREQIVVALWPDAGGPKASSSFHSTLHRVRRAIYREAVIESGGSYGLNPDSELISDVNAFRVGVETAMSAGSFDLDRAAMLRESLGLYRGPFAPGIESEWAEAIRVSLENSFLQSSLRMAEFCVETGDYISAVKTAERVLEIDPFSENACLLLMRAHAGSGDLESAQRVYRRVAETLELELGELPGERLAAFHAELRRPVRRSS